MVYVCRTRHDFALAIQATCFLHFAENWKVLVQRRTFGTEGKFRIKKSCDTNSPWRSNATLIPKAKSSKFLGPARALYSHD